MEQRFVNKTLHINGMTCTSCESRIETRLSKIKGVQSVKADYVSSNVSLTYDENEVDLSSIIVVIEKLDYRVDNGQSVPSNDSPNKKNDKNNLNISQIVGIAVIIFALYLIINNTIGFNFIPKVSSNMGYGVLFVIGLMTSLHCIAMCGGINLSQCVKYNSEGDSKLARLRPSLMYNTGRVISYTIIGGIVGAVGSVISFSGMAKGIVAIIAGIFMIIMGLNMLNIFPWLRKFNPRIPKVFSKKINNSTKERGPLFVGLLNGLMPCGPLQAMQIYALGTGSLVVGATSMFFFSLGTVPLMFGFGAASTLLSSKFTHKMMKASAVLVAILGIVMINRGLNISNFSVPKVSKVFAASNSEKSVNKSKVKGNVQEITTNLKSGEYTPITVQKGIPVKWTIKANASDITGCNGTMVIPKLNIEKSFKPGDNIIEFTPTEAGDIPYSCSMGMITSNIKVVSNLSKDNKSAKDSKGSVSTETPKPSPSSMGCCRPSK